MQVESQYRSFKCPFIRYLYEGIRTAKYSAKTFIQKRWMLRTYCSRTTRSDMSAARRPAIVKVTLLLFVVLLINGSSIFGCVLNVDPTFQRWPNKVVPFIFNPNDYSERFSALFFLRTLLKGGQVWSLINLFRCRWAKFDHSGHAANFERHGPVHYMVAVGHPAYHHRPQLRDHF